MNKQVKYYFYILQNTIIMAISPAIQGVSSIIGGLQSLAIADF